MSELIRREDVLDFLQIVPIDLGYREIDDVEAFIKSLPADVRQIKRCAKSAGKDGRRNRMDDLIRREDALKEICESLALFLFGG